jgi:hypothetical protein
MHRKRRTLKLAQKYLERNECKVSKMHLYQEELHKGWKSFLRWLSNTSTYLIPWQTKIKRIESHYGSVVSSYFTFLRWVIFMNFMITLLILAFVVIPEVSFNLTIFNFAFSYLRMLQQIVHGKKEPTHANNCLRMKSLTPMNFKLFGTTGYFLFYLNTYKLQGYLRYSPLFYGFYSNDEFDTSKGIHYSIPIAYFLTVLLVFGYSFFAILRK